MPRLPSFIAKRLFRWYKKIEVQEHPLLYLFLEITRRCNLSCIHCGSDCSSSVHAPELTTESWISIIRYIKNVFGKSVTFVITGGEPLVHPDLEKITAEIQAQDMNWGMVTNGFALTETKWNNLVKNGLSSVTISMDGMKKSHDKLRNRDGAYEKTVDAMEIIGRSGIRFKDAVTCVYPDNLNELDQIAELLIDKGMTSWRLFRIFPLGRVRQNPGLLLSYQDTMRVLDWIKRNRAENKKRGLSVSYSCEGWMPHELDKGVRDLPFFCRAGINMASILCDGTITGCSNNQPRFHEGNILKDDLLDLWQNGFHKFRDRSWAKSGKCGKCRHFKECQGSSIHLWSDGSDSPAFCYADDH